MANLLDYLSWRGDLPLTAVPLGEADRAVLCRVAYLPFENAVPTDFSASVPLDAALRTVLLRARMSKDEHFFHIKDDRLLCELLLTSDRFLNCRLTAYETKFNTERQEQFAAVTLLLPDGSAAALFRGTDGTLIGWKEDFNMAVSDEVPAQRDALSYLTRLAGAYDRPLHVMGHSKGGNLAVYAAAFGSETLTRRILSVRSLDGPGLSEALAASEDFRRVRDRVRTILPSSSVIGMLLEHAEDFTVVQSRSVGLFQHNLYNWQLQRGDFVTVEKLTNSSRYTDATLREWLRRLSPEQREQFVDCLYDILSASDGRTLRELRTGRSVVAIAKALRTLDGPSKQIMNETLRALMQVVKDELPTPRVQVKHPSPSEAKLTGVRKRQRSTRK